MKKQIIFLTLAVLWLCGMPAMAQQDAGRDTAAVVAVTDSLPSDTLTADSLMAAVDEELGAADTDGEGGGLHKQLKRKFIEGSAGFMSLVALALVIGLALCIERIV